MRDAETIDLLLADLKLRFLLRTLTYAEAVMIEDLIAIIPQVDPDADEALAKCVAETPSDGR